MLKNATDTALQATLALISWMLQQPKRDMSKSPEPEQAAGTLPIAASWTFLLFGASPRHIQTQAMLGKTPTCLHARARLQGREEDL